MPSATRDGSTVILDLPELKRERVYLFGVVDQNSDNLQKINLTGFTQLVQKEFSNQIDVTMVQTPMMTMERSMLLDTYNKQRSYGATSQTDWTFGDSHHVVARVAFSRAKPAPTSHRADTMILTNLP